MGLVVADATQGAFYRLRDVTGCAYLTSICVPPVNSMERFRPPIAQKMMPGTIIKALRA